MGSHLMKCIMTASTPNTSYWRAKEVKLLIFLSRSSQNTNHSKCIEYIVIYIERIYLQYPNTVTSRW